MTTWQQTQRGGFHIKTVNIKIHDELHAPQCSPPSVFKISSTRRPPEHKTQPQSSTSSPLLHFPNRPLPSSVP